MNFEGKSVNFNGVCGYIIFSEKLCRLVNIAFRYTTIDY